MTFEECKRNMTRSATFSPCRTYRYALWRRWEPGKPYAMFIGLNPSTADEVLDDPTVRRCTRYAYDWGYGGLCMTNIFAYRATDPKVMKAAGEPVGVDNDRWLKKFATCAGVVVAAWGIHGSYKDRGAEVAGMIPWLKCLGTTKQGHPRHPLYLPLNATPEEMPK